LNERSGPSRATRSAFSNNYAVGYSISITELAINIDIKMYTTTCYLHIKQGDNEFRLIGMVIPQAEQGDEVSIFYATSFDNFYRKFFDNPKDIDFETLMWAVNWIKKDLEMTVYLIDDNKRMSDTNILPWHLFIYDTVIASFRLKNDYYSANTYILRGLTIIHIIMFFISLNFVTKKWGI
jgi:hypothetical protein